MIGFLEFHITLSPDQLLYKLSRDMIGFLEFHITPSPDQLLYKLSLIKLCSTCAKHNASVNASDIVHY